MKLPRNDKAAVPGCLFVCPVIEFGKLGRGAMKLFKHLFAYGVTAMLAVAALGSGALAGKEVPKDSAQIQLSFSPVVAKAAPAVVNIYTRTMVRTRRSLPLFDDPFFRRFFGEDFGPFSGKPNKRQQNSLGSGVIVDPDGVIVTNKHVIEGADEITVVLADRREFDATVVAKDDRTDLAILQIKVDGAPLTHIELKNSDDLEVGDLVLAIGNPFGVGQTVTSGIVSALARTQIGVGGLSSFIQTDAAINPGNSGGALVSMDGRLVGINTAIFSKSGGSHGIGFAIPSNMVRAVVTGLSRTGTLVRPWLGASGQTVTHDISASLGMERPMGVLVSELYKGGSAERAGVRIGDVLLAVNGHEVNDARDLRHRIATLAVGDTTVLRVWRRSEIIAVKIEMSRAPEMPARSITILDGVQPLAGATVANMSPALAEELGGDPYDQGVIVINIKRGTNAHRLRFRVGDYLRSINDTEVGTVGQLSKLLHGEERRWDITIERNGESLNLVVDR